MGPKDDVIPVFQKTHSGNATNSNYSEDNAYRKQKCSMVLLFHGLLPELSVTSENPLSSLLFDATVAMTDVYLCKHILNVTRDALSYKFVH